MNRFETERLSAERIRPEHLPLLLELHADPHVMATLGGVRSPEQTQAALARWIAGWERDGFGLYLLRERETGAFIGRAGLRRVEIEGRPEVELAYALAAEFWGRGLATEAARALVDIARELGIDDVVAFTQPENVASRRVMEKAGLAYERDIVHAGDQCLLYRL